MYKYIALLELKRPKNIQNQRLYPGLSQRQAAVSFLPFLALSLALPFYYTLFAITAVIYVSCQPALPALS